MGVRFVIRSAEGKPLSEELAYGFEQSRVVIGRGSGADVRIPHLTVSEVHATVRLDADGYGIVDDDSTNGTRVNGTKLTSGRKKRLQDGDRIEIGAYELTFHAAVALAQAVTAERTAELARRLFRVSQAGAQLGAPRMVVLSGPQTGRSLDVPPPPSRSLIGSGASCQLALGDPEVAAEHAELIRDLDGVLIRATESAHAAGALEINRQRVAQRRLRDGDELVLGSTRLLFEDPADEPIEGLGQENDRPLTPPPSAPPASAEPAEPAQLAQAQASSRARPTRPFSFDADLVIYGLAAIVIAASVAGLIALMSAN